ncbi:transcriptional regulator, TetR family [Modestobacter sp. DSM 44400]|uniref:mycofactocin system transcriptional regulator n=1 Tax=Modestobacter sp. DSM 44400 TaxID=1550230 RepID=UPI000898820B|nr:mycofactocin system transcriptional regulator [Modestobacter sp. DSM 44400]SDY33003.1 transcriptional regulator, TetR family [Modestobacter sp. DSM 44400]
MSETTVVADPRGETRLRIERAALDLFTSEGFDEVTTDAVADAAGISRRTFFRYFATKADAVWGDFTAHVNRLEVLLAAAGDHQPVLTSICRAYVEVNDYATDDLPMLRQRLRLIFTEPALQAHSQVRYAAVDRAVADHVARRTGASAGALVPRLVATSTRAAATTAFEVWLADGRLPLAWALHDAFDELAAGFPSLRPARPAVR